MRLRNTNPYGAVEIPILHLVVERDEEFDVDDDIGGKLLEQTGNYELVEQE